MIEIWLYLLGCYMSKNLLQIIGVLMVVAVPATGFLYWRRKRLRKYFKIIWRKSSSLKPKDLLELRPYYRYYHRRDEDELISKSLLAGHNVLIVGPPLSGKTRAAYQALSNLNKACDVLIARSTDIDLENFLFPKQLKFWRRKVLVIDDLHRFVEQQNFEHLFRVADENRTTIIATCRSGFECDKAKAKIGERSLDFDMIFGQNVFELGKISPNHAQKVAKQTGIDWAKVRFDGTIGSVFMKLSEMETRFNKCGPEEKTILRALRKLYLCGVYEENQVFPLKWVTRVAKTDQLEGKTFEWNQWIEGLKGKEFVRLQKETVQAEEVYLQDIVKPDVGLSKLELLGSMLGALSGVPDALFRLGNRAYTVGEVGLDRADYMKIAIKAYEQALKVRTLDRFPMDYGMSQNNLGNAYSTLAEVEAKAENCKRAKRAYEEALKVYTKKEFPQIHLLVQQNLTNLLDFCKDE